MPRRTDISKILIIGSGPIIIGQSAEFDYSGTQACKALKAEGFEVVLANSNPATIMTDPEIADRTYIEPLTRDYLEEIIRVERELSPGKGFAILPTVGGQTALNVAVELSDGGILDKYNVQLIGASIGAIKKAEDRLFFKDAMQRIGLDVPKSALVNNLKDGLEFAGKIGFPVIIRPSFTLGGTGGGIAYNREELMEVLARGLDFSPVHEALIEESVIGWKEYELEVMRDLKDNVVIICSIENFDPMGVHTGDSITVAPAQTLTDREYQKLRDMAITIIRKVGVVMAIGRTFKESLFKGLRSLEAVKPLRLEDVSNDELQRKLARPNSQRFSYITYALEHGWTIDEIYRLSRIDRWFLDQLKQVMEIQEQVESVPPALAGGSSSDQPNTPKLENIPLDLLRAFKEAALSDRRLAYLTKRTEDEVRAYRKSLGLIAVYKRVDTCGAEFESYTPYLYSTYEEEDEAQPTDRRKIMILGSGPNRIGQGIEFDYCCCHASFALHEAGWETIMVNCNPETVSTDYDTSDRLYFEPLTFEDVMNIVDVEKPTGVIVQFGGQTPLNLAMRLHEAGVPIIGTSPDSIDLAEDRKRFGALLNELGIPQPENGTATSIEGAREAANRIGYPVLVRPSYVLGGRAMAIVYV